MHNRKQQLTFFLVVQKYLEEELFLPKIIRRLKEDLSHKTRTIIDKRAEKVELDEDLNMIKVLTLFYCLHTQKPKHGYMSMLTKHLIKDTEIDFDPENIKATNERIKELIVEIGLPELHGTAKQFINNVYYYKPDFIDRYPDLENRVIASR